MTAETFLATRKPRCLVCAAEEQPLWALCPICNPLPDRYAWPVSWDVENLLRQQGRDVDGRTFTEQELADLQELGWLIPLTEPIAA